MSQNLADIIQNTKDIYLSKSSLETIMDFERVLDSVDMYVFKNWKLGELVEGPISEKYFVTASFMWPHKLMPDPRGGERLLNFGCEVYYSKQHLLVPNKVESPDDYVPGTKMPKYSKKPIWVVTVVMPKTLMQDIAEGSVELESSKIESDDIDDAYADMDKGDSV